MRDLIHLSSDEEMEDAPSAEVEEPAAAPISPEPVMPKKEKEEMVVSVSGGRRRGRRRVMKKKTVKDEEGYLGKSSASIGNN